MKKFLVLVLFFVVLVSFTNYAHAITTGFVPFQIEINSVTDLAYVSNSDGTVTVIDVDTESLSTVIAVDPGSALIGIAIDESTNTIYVANPGSNEVSIIDADDSNAVTSISLLPFGVFPVDVEINTTTKTLYVTNVLSLTIIVIDIDPTHGPFFNTIIDVIPGFDSPASAAFDSLENKMYVTNFIKNEVNVLDGTKSFILSGGLDSPLIDSIPIGSTSDGLEINPTTKKLYTANSGSNTISVINIDSGSGGAYNTVIDTITVGENPVDVAIDELTNTIFVTIKNEGTIAVIDGDTGIVTSLVPVDTFGVTAPRLRGLAFDTEPGSGDVYVVNSGPVPPTPGIVSIVDFSGNHPPTARAGSNQVVGEGVLVTLDGSSSSDPDGDGLSFSWVKEFGPTITLLTSSSTSASFTTPTVNADTLFTFKLTVDDTAPLTSFPDFVNVVVEDDITITVPSTLTDGVISGSETIGDIFAGTSYALQIDGVLPSAELKQLVIPTGVTSTGVTFDFTESSQVPSGFAFLNIEEVALFLDLTFGGVDFSTASNFVSGILPKVQFLLDSDTESVQSFADGCPVIDIQLLDENGLWQLIGDTEQTNKNKIYVSNVGTGLTAGTLSVIDGNTNNIIDTITVGFAPKLVAFDQNNNRIYVPNQGSNSVSVIDGSTNTVIATIPVGVAPIQAAFNPNTGNVYVTNQGDGNVSVINGSTNTVIKTITTGTTPVGVGVDTVLNRIFVSNNFGSSVTVIDGTDDTVLIQSLPIGQPSGMEIDSINSKAYISNFDNRSITVLNTATFMIEAVIGVGANPTNLSYNPSTSRLYVADQISSTVSVIDTDINAVVATIPSVSGPFDLEANPNTNRVYVSNRGSGTVSVIDGMSGSPTENTVIETITGFLNNFGLALNPDVSNPVRDPSKDAGGQCAYIAEPPHFSKFAIGGVALALGGVGGSADGSPPVVTLNNLISNTNFEAPDEIIKIVENYDPTMILESISTSKFPDFDFPLTINENGYPLASYSNTIETFSGDVGEPISITPLYYEQSVIQHVSMYLNLRDTNTGDLSKSDTQILYNKDKPIEVIDPNGYFESVSVNIVEDGDNKKFAQFEIVFAKSLEKSDMVLRSWDEKLRSLDTIIYDAIEVIGSENIVDETLESESVEELIPQDTDLEQDTHTVPEWIKNNAEWWSQGEIDDAAFKKSIQFLIQEKIIDVPTGPNVSVSKDDGFVEEEVEQTIQIPKWIKNNAEWWYLGQLTDDEFIKSIEYLVQENIIRI